MEVVEKLRVPEQLLERIERDATGNGFYAEAVPQALGCGVGTGDLRRLHYGSDYVLPFRPAPVPQPE
jgi:hypothetical protein